jgi:hemerythrin
MKALCWLDSMSVGVAELDDDHKRIIAALGEIRTALDAGEREKAYGLSLGLLNVARAHVAKEYAFLHEIGFPGIEAVISAQNASLDNIRTLSAQILSDMPAGQELATSMAHAFVQYLLRADINFKSYVEAAGRSDIR